MQVIKSVQAEPIDWSRDGELRAPDDDGLGAFVGMFWALVIEAVFVLMVLAACGVIG